MTALQVWPAEVTPDYTFQIEVANLTNPDAPIYVAIEDPTLLPNQWNTIGVTNNIVSPGTDLLVVLNSINSAADVVWDHPWVYEGISNAIGPIAGEWNKRQQEDLIRINDVDADAIDQSVDLAAVITGTQFTITDQADPTALSRYYVNNSVDQGTR